VLPAADDDSPLPFLLSLKPCAGGRSTEERRRDLPWNHGFTVFFLFSFLPDHFRNDALLVVIAKHDGDEAGRGQRRPLPLPPPSPPLLSIRRA